MADFPLYPMMPDDRSAQVISVFSGWALGPAVSASAGANISWPTANRAIFWPFRVPVAVTACKMACGAVTGTGGNFDLGIYDAVGNRVVSSGLTARPGASQKAVVDLVDTVLLPGMYYMAMSVDGTTGWAGPTTPVNVGICKLLGMRQMAAACPLPATATFGTITTAGSLFYVAIYLRDD